MKEKKRKLAVTLVASIIAIIAILGGSIAVSGYRGFTSVLEQQYNDSAYEVAETALSYLNPDKFEEYLETGQTDEEYDRILNLLDELVVASNCNFIYVGKIDPSDYLTTTYIYDSVNPATGFDRYEFGFVSQDTDPQYVEELKRIINTGGRAEKYLYSYSESGAHTTAGLAVKDSAGNVVAVIGVEKPMTILENARSEYVKKVALITVNMMLLTILLYVLWLNYMLIQPIVEITNEAMRFADNSEEPASSLKAVKNRYEIGTLAVSIQKMESDIKNYIENLTTVTAEKERIGAELNVATHIQSSMLPRIFPPFPDRKEFDIFASMTPAKEVGGDFYDFFMVDNTHLAIVMADVSGKGVPAALFMVIGKTLIKDHTQPGVSLGDIFSDVNNILCDSNSEGMFITAFEGVLDLETGELAYANAGHEMPYIYRKGESFEPYKVKAGFVLAGMEDLRYKEGRVQLSPGDKIFLYTDGVPEATDAYNGMYGLERMQNILNEHKGKNPKEILAEVKEDVDRFVKDAPQFDDLTMLCLEYKGNIKEH